MKTLLRGNNVNCLTTLELVFFEHPGDKVDDPTSAIPCVQMAAFGATSPLRRVPAKVR